MLLKSLQQTAEYLIAPGSCTVAGPVRSVNGQRANPYIWSAIKKIASVTVHNLPQHITELTTVMTRTWTCNDVLAHSKCPRFKYRTSGWPPYPSFLFLSGELHDGLTFDPIADQQHIFLIQLTIIYYLCQGFANCGWQKQCGPTERTSGLRVKIF